MDGRPRKLTPPILRSAPFCFLSICGGIHQCIEGTSKAKRECCGFRILIGATCEFVKNPTLGGPTAAWPGTAAPNAPTFEGFSLIGYLDVSETGATATQPPTRQALRRHPHQSGSIDRLVGCLANDRYPTSQNLSVGYSTLNDLRPPQQRKRRPKAATRLTAQLALSDVFVPLLLRARERANCTFRAEGNVQRARDFSTLADPNDGLEDPHLGAGREDGV
jgi:hypothetical protein